MYRLDLLILWQQYFTLSLQDSPKHCAFKGQPEARSTGAWQELMSNLDRSGLYGNQTLMPQNTLGLKQANNPCNAVGAFGVAPAISVEMGRSAACNEM